MGKMIVRKSVTDQAIVKALNAVTLSDVREYDIRASADGSRWLTATVWFRDEPATDESEPDKEV
jgi:hypothetical protein